MGLWRRFWLGLWHGIPDADDDIKEIQAILTIIDTSEPTSKSPAVYGHIPSEPQSGWKGWTLKFVQSTPDGDLETTITTEPQIAEISVTLSGVGCLKTLLYFVNGSSDPRGSAILHAKVNKFAVQFVHAWVAQRVLPELEASEQKCRAAESARREREVNLARLRKKLLP